MIRKFVVRLAGCGVGCTKNFVNSGRLRNIHISSKTPTAAQANWSPRGSMNKATNRIISNNGLELLGEVRSLL